MKIPYIMNEDPPIITKKILNEEKVLKPKAKYPQKTVKAKYSLKTVKSKIKCCILL